MKKIIKLSERDLTRILSEALGGGGYDLSSIDKLKIKYPNGFPLLTVTSSGTSTFKNGIDTINGQNPGVKNILNTILAGCNFTNIKCSRKVTVTISGGASAVGNSKGYDNKSLAARRRDNFISFLKRLDVISINRDFIDIVAGGTKVGKATVKDSPEAEKEQYVSAAISTKKDIPLKGVEGDNTNVSNQIYDKNKFNKKTKLIKGGKTKRVCVQIPDYLVDKFQLKVREFRKEQGLGSIPYGVYDIKK